MIYEKPQLAMPEPEGLTTGERELLSDLYEVWSNKLSRNQLKMEYYRQKNRFKNIGVAIPPDMEHKLSAVIGWPAKAVDALGYRSQLQGFVSSEGDMPELASLMEANDMATKYKMARQTELIHSCAFFTVTRGNVAAGEPAAIISAYSAETAAALWDYRRNRILAGLCVTDFDRRSGEPTRMNLYTSDAVVELVRQPHGWEMIRHPHMQGRPLMVPMAYKKELGRPFGNSRISRAVMSITDAAVRCVARTELSSEFYTSPQKYLLGADKSVVTAQTKYEAYLGNVFAITKDAEGDVPQYGQLTQASMQPHADSLRSLAAQFAGETYIPISYLGVIHDNPASAEAMYAASEELIIAAEELNDGNGAALADVAMLALAIATNRTLGELTDVERSVRPVFANPTRSSLAARADAMSKIVGTIPWIGDTRVALEWLGFNESEITRLMAEKRRIEGQTLAQAILSGVASENTGEGGEVTNDGDDVE